MHVRIEPKLKKFAVLFSIPEYDFIVGRWEGRMKRVIVYAEDFEQAEAFARARLGWRVSNAPCAGIINE